MEFKGPWRPRQGHPFCEAAQLLVNGPRQTHFLLGQQQNFSGSGREEQLSTLFIQILSWQYSECCVFFLFAAGSETIRGATGGTCLHMAFRGGVFAERRNLLPRSLLPTPLGLPTPTSPTPANGHVSVNTEDEKHAIFECVSFTVTHFFSLCILADPRLKIPSDCSQVGFQGVLHI